MIPRNLVHLGSERARCDAAHHDVVLHQPQRHALDQVDQAGLAGRVRIGFLRVDRDAVDRRDVDHLPGRSRGRAQLLVQRW